MFQSTEFYSIEVNSSDVEVMYIDINTLRYCAFKYASNKYLTLKVYFRATGASLCKETIKM